MHSFEKTIILYKKILLLSDYIFLYLKRNKIKYIIHFKINENIKIF